MKKMKQIFILIIILLLFSTSICFANSKLVIPTESKIFLDSEQINFETYLIDGYNYFKLRDLAYVFNNTTKSFQVDWNEELNKIDILLNNKYIPIGTELTDLNPNKDTKAAISTSSDIYINGIKKIFKTYNIDGYNYFKLRDLLKIIDCGVVYDELSQDINIYTYLPYDSNEYVKIPILMYHHFDPATDGTNNMIITPQKFENDIITILNKGYTPILFKELINYVEYGYAIPQNPIIITIDDGYLSNYEYVFPILKKYNTKACIFPVVRYSEENLSNYPHFNYLQANEMISSGLVEIQSHTYDMHIQIIDIDAFSIDNLKAIKHLKDNLNSDIYAFSFPYGIHNEDLQQVLDNEDIKVSVITDEGLNFIQKEDRNSLKKMKRYLITQYTDLRVLLDEIDNTEK